MSLRLLACALICGSLIACGPVYKTNYSLTPPSDQAGRQCVLQCQEMKQACSQAAYDRHHSCRAIEADRAEQLFREYKIERLAQGLPVERSYKSFSNAKSCGKETSYARSCTPDFRSCFATCGGQVTAQTVCVSNCE